MPLNVPDDNVLLPVLGDDVEDISAFCKKEITVFVNVVRINLYRGLQKQRHSLVYQLPWKVMIGGKVSPSIANP